MIMTSETATEMLIKAPTGIRGFDGLSGGGLPQGRTTLLGGNAGSGKTVFALQTLMNGAREYGEPGIFVAFEENSRRIMANAEKFGWRLPTLHPDKLFFLDAQPSYDMICSGQFDLGGMLAILDAKVAELGAKRIVLDAIDVVLVLMRDATQMRREIYRLHDWLLRRGLTALITAKVHSHELDDGTPKVLDFMQFMVDCSVILGHDLVDGTSQRNMRIIKYRGSAFEENAVPYLIGFEGIDVACSPNLDVVSPATHERVSSGIDRLDTMLGGGYFRGASILLTGAPGTAKTTLCGTFVEAAYRRQERSLFVSFDSRTDELIRNMSSVGIHLAEAVDSGLLHMTSARGTSGSAEIHLMQITTLAQAHKARCVVIDPLSALSKSGNRATSHSVAERLVDWAKAEGMTLMCTSLLDRTIPDTDGTPLQISTIADTWIHLSYVVQAGERNRGISIVKSRGTGHSNQVRELLLGSSGVTLTDVYTAGGEVLMGAQRWVRERAERLANAERTAAAFQRRMALESQAADLEARLKALQREIAANSREREILSDAETERTTDLTRAEVELRALRVGDAPRVPNIGKAGNE
jgi:circadian clock protein KaiC